MKILYLKPAEFIKQLYLSKGLHDVVDDYNCCPECNELFSRGPYQYEDFKFDTKESREGYDINAPFTIQFKKYIAINFEKEEESVYYDDAQLIVPLEATNIFWTDKLKRILDDV